MIILQSSLTCCTHQMGVFQAKKVMEFFIKKHLEKTSNSFQPTLCHCRSLFLLPGISLEPNEGRRKLLYILHGLNLPFQLDDDDEQVACIKRDLSNQKRMLTDSIRVSIFSKLILFFILIADIWQADIQAFSEITLENSTGSLVNFLAELSFIEIAGPEPRFRGYFYRIEWTFIFLKTLYSLFFIYKHSVF